MDIGKWDFVCACTIEKLNELLAAQFKKTPASITYTETNGTVLKADFNPWQIVPGGTEQKLYIEMPINKGSITSPLAQSDLSGAVPIIEVELDFFKDASTGKTNLKFNFQSKAKGPKDTTKGAIFVSNPDSNGVLKKRDASGTTATQLHDALPECLIHNKDKLDYVFATLNLTPTGDGSWLAPKHFAYAFQAKTKPKKNFLAVFSALTDRDVSKYSTDVDESLFDDKNDVFAAFSGPVFMEHMVMPNLPASYPGSTIKNFECKNGVISNIFAKNPIIKGLRLPLKCKPVKVSLTHYYPILASLDISIESSKLHSTAAGYFDITGLADSYVTFTCRQDAEASFDASSGKLTFKSHGKPVTDYDKHIPTWLYFVAGPAILALGPIVGLIVVAIVDSIIAAVSSSVANATSGSSSNLAIGDVTSKAVDWPGGKKWKVTDAGLSDALFLRCKM